MHYTAETCSAQIRFQPMFDQAETMPLGFKHQGISKTCNKCLLYIKQRVYVLITSGCFLEPIFELYLKLQEQLHPQTKKSNMFWKVRSQQNQKKCFSLWTVASSVGVSYSRLWRWAAWRRRRRQSLTTWRKRICSGLVAIWASTEFQEKVKNSTAKSKLYAKHVKGMSKAGFAQMPHQIINNHKKLKDYQGSKTAILPLLRLLHPE